MTDQFEIKIAYIGGGSRYWARLLMADLALCPYLTGEIALYDIDFEAAQKNVAHAADIFRHPDAQTTFQVNNYHTSAEALQGADFVVLSILPGPMQMFANDIDIPTKYGIIQTVADTTGPGGISRSMRTVSTYVDYAHQIMQYCPAAWVINYTNPMTVCTAALYAAEPNIKAFGCCHEVFGTQSHLAGLVHDYFEVPRPPRQEIRTDIAGVNHFTWAIRATWEGHDLFPIIEQRMNRDGFWDNRTAIAEERKIKGQFFGSHKLIAYDFYRRFGAFGAAGDRHLVEFVPWYLSSEAVLQRYGVNITPSSYRLGTWRPPQNAPVQPEPQNDGKLKGSGEEGVAQMLALLGAEPLDTNVNIPNVGQMPDVPLGAVVETNAQFRKDSLSPIVPKPLPTGAQALVRRVVDVQQMTLNASLAKDKEMAFQALLNDPLVTIPVDRAWEMFNEMFEANRELLEGWQ